MSRIAHYLQEHLVGEVTDSLDVRRYFSHDASILQVTPSVVVYPANENDVRKTARFCWQLAERDKILPITARGGGTDTSGAAIGSGVMMAFTAHMNRILALTPAKQSVSVEPGITFAALQQTLYTHGHFLPPYPASSAYATIGGSLANNSIGEKSVKYGDMAAYVQKLHVVLANGEVIETGPLNKRDLNKKMGMSNMEGSVYRGIDGLLEENQALINDEESRLKARHHRSGYNLFDVKKKGDFNLTPLFLGSQGTLGIVTEATLKLVPHNPLVELSVLSLDSLSELHDALPSILELQPSICEMINRAAIVQLNKSNPSMLKGILQNPGAEIHLILEFDDTKEGAQKKSLKALAKLAEKTGGYLMIAADNKDRDNINKLRRAAASLHLESRGTAKAVPVAEDVAVPIDRLADFLRKAGEIYTGGGLQPAMWGHAGDGVVRMHPLLDLAQTGDRQKLYKLQDMIFNAALNMGGSISAAAGDGRIRAPYMGHVYSPQMRQLMMQVKEIFDPYGILNRGVKTASAEEVKSLMRTEYTRAGHEHLPHI